jgi:hypothetical protein
MLLAESAPEAVFESVYKEFAGIVKQNVWRTPTGRLVYTQDVDMETLYKTMLNIYMGDYALLCLELSDDGADADSAFESDYFCTLVGEKILEHLLRATPNTITHHIRREIRIRA